MSGAQAGEGGADDRELGHISRELNVRGADLETMSVVRGGEQAGERKL